MDSEYQKKRSERLVKKLLKKREADRIRKPFDPIIGGVNERPGRSNPTITRREPREDDLVIEDDGTIGRDIGLSPGEQAGEILFHAQAKPKPEPETPLNNAARERLERQISDLMAKVNQGLRDYQNATRDALDILEMARTSVYTEPLGEVSVTLAESARRLTVNFPKEARTVNRLCNLALEIRQSEEPKKGNK